MKFWPGSTQNMYVTQPVVVRFLCLYACARCVRNYQGMHMRTHTLTRVHTHTPRTHTHTQSRTHAHTYARTLRAMHTYMRKQTDTHHTTYITQHTQHTRARCVHIQTESDADLYALVTTSG